MHRDRFLELVDKIKEKFEVEEHERVEKEERGGTTTEYITFEGPIGLMKLEFISRPKVEDKKTTYSNRIGSEVEIDYIYSETEKVTEFHVYKWSEADDSWVEIEASKFAL